jgi:hypothetical protein
MNNDTTSIMDLPTDPVGVNTNNITMHAQEQARDANGANNGNNGGAGMSLDQSTINQIVNGLQQAKLTGATQLPSRDIPMTTTAITNDPQIMPNYVPPPHTAHQNYIQDDLYNKYDQPSSNKHNTLDDAYDELQTPLLIAILYFLFQLPFFKKFLYNNLSFLFMNDGNYNLNGYLFTSALFGILFHMLTKITKYFNTF